MFLAILQRELTNNEVHVYRRVQSFCRTHPGLWVSLDKIFPSPDNKDEAKRKLGRQLLRAGAMAAAGLVVDHQGRLKWPQGSTGRAECDERSCTA